MYCETKTCEKHASMIFKAVFFTEKQFAVSCKIV